MANGHNRKKGINEQHSAGWHRRKLYLRAQFAAEGAAAVDAGEVLDVPQEVLEDAARQEVLEDVSQGYLNDPHNHVVIWSW